MVQNLFKILFIVITILAHLLDDFFFQTILSNMKQKSWWKQNYTDEQYKNDYKMALFCHSLEHSCMIMIPSIIYNIAYPSSYDQSSYIINNKCNNSYVYR